MNVMPPNETHKRIKSFTILTSVALYVLSLTQPALTYKGVDGSEKLSAFSMLFSGGLAFLGGGFLETLIWLANLFYLAALRLFYRSNNASSGTALVATGLALSFLGFDEILVSESGFSGIIMSLNAGYWLWALGLTCLTIGSIYYFNKIEKGIKSEKEMYFEK